MDANANRRTTLQAIWVVLLSDLMYSVIEVFIRQLNQHYQLHQVIFLRCIMALPVLLVIFAPIVFKSITADSRSALSTPWWHTSVPWLHTLRLLISVVSMAGIYYAVTHIPLGLAAALTSTSPLFLLAMSPWLLRERVSTLQWLDVCISFAGVLLIVGPAASDQWLGMSMGILGAIASAAVMVCLRLLGKTEDTRYSSLFNIIGLCVISGAGLGLLGYKPVSPAHWASAAAVGLLGGIGQLLGTWAFRHANAAILAPLGYSAVLWGALFGWWLWDEVLPLRSWLGMIAIIVGGVIATRD